MLTNRRSTTISLETYHLFPLSVLLSSLVGHQNSITVKASLISDQCKSYAFDRFEVGIFAED